MSTELHTSIPRYLCWPVSSAARFFHRAEKVQPRGIRRGWWRSSCSSTKIPESNVVIFHQAAVERIPEALIACPHCLPRRLSGKTAREFERAVALIVDPVNT